MNKEIQLPPGIEFSYPANYLIYRGRAKEWLFEEELYSARKEGEGRDLCHLDSGVLLENIETGEKIPGRISGIYRYRLAGYYGRKRYQKTSFLFRVKTDGGGKVLYPMWQPPKELILRNAETGRNFHCRE